MCGKEKEIELKTALVQARNSIRAKFNRLHNQRVVHEKHLKENLAPITSSINRLIDGKRFRRRVDSKLLIKNEPKSEPKEEAKTEPEQENVDVLRLQDPYYNHDAALNRAFSVPDMQRYNIKLESKEDAEVKREENDSDIHVLDKQDENDENDYDDDELSVVEYSDQEKNFPIGYMELASDDYDDDDYVFDEDMNEDENVSILRQPKFPKKRKKMSIDDDNDDDNDNEYNVKYVVPNKNRKIKEARKTSKSDKVESLSGKEYQHRLKRWQTVQNLRDMQKAGLILSQEKIKKLPKSTTVTLKPKPIEYYYSPEDYNDNGKYIGPYPQRSKVLSHVPLKDEAFQETLQRARRKRKLYNKSRSSDCSTTRRKQTNEAENQSNFVGKGLEKAFIPYTNNIAYEYYDDANELCDRLYLLISSKTAGNTNHDQEINSIIEELRESDIIE